MTPSRSGTPVRRTSSAKGSSGHDVDDDEAGRRDVDDGEVRIDPVHAVEAGDRIRARRHDLARAVAGPVFHHHVDRFRADRQVHRAADRRNRVRAAGVPVREVACDRHLERAQHAAVEVPAAHHRERIGVVEVRCAGQRGHRLLAGVDEIGVLGAGLGCRTHAEQPVLRVQDDLAIARQMVGDQCRQADAEVHVGAVRGCRARRARPSVRG